MSKDRPSNSREHINRAHKAMGIVSNIQDFCDDPTNIKPMYEGGDEVEHFQYADFLPAVKNPLRPESVAILSQFCQHCRSWPSRETWRYVEEFLTNYEITKLNINNTSSNESD